MIKVIGIDLDGTTIKKDGSIGELTKEAIKEAIESGIEVCVCTGRSLNAIPDVIRELKEVKYVATSNGARITNINTNETVYENYLNPSAVDYILNLSIKENLMLEVFMDNQAYIDERLYKEIEKNGSKYRSRRYVLISRKPIKDIITFARENKEKIENINIFFTDLKRLEEIKPLVNKTKKATITQSFPNNIEVGGENTSKKTALSFLIDKLGAKQEELMCLGDALNDMAMIKFAGVGIAMGNAWDELKEVADYVTDDNNNDGVGKAIYKFALNNKKY